MDRRQEATAEYIKWKNYQNYMWEQYMYGLITWSECEKELEKARENCESAQRIWQIELDKEINNEK